MSIDIEVCQPAFSLPAGAPCHAEPVCIVAVPVCNERERIVRCLDALAAQVDVPAGALGIVLFLNNCTDGTYRVVENWMVASPWPVRLIERDNAMASAGWARGAAMQAAADWLIATACAGGFLMTTDADSHVPPDWVARNKAALAAGADAVAGRVAFDAADIAALPDGLRRRQKLEAEYEASLAEIEARLAPRRGNPWPCHWMKSGASIAVSLSAYLRVGGVPALRTGEDHAFIDLLGCHGLVVRHATDIVVTTSGRLDGRARGGTSDTLTRWSRDAESPCEPRLRRVGPFVWDVVRGHAPAVHRQPLKPSELPCQIARARLLLKLLRMLAARRGDRLRVALPIPAQPKLLPMS